MVGPRAIPYRTLPSAAAGGSSKNPSSTVILNACRVANELWFKKKEKGKHKSKDMDKAQEPRFTLGGSWGVGGDVAAQGSLYSKWFILQMTGSLESLPSSPAAPAQ